MPIDWHPYDAFDWVRSQQSPMDAPQRAVIETLAADLLGLSEEDRRQLWGVASPPGRYAATVVHGWQGVSADLKARAGAAGIEALAVKLFKNTPDALREGRRALALHNGSLHRLPGLPNEHVQKSLTAGALADPCGGVRYYILQEWIRGDTLEDLLRRTWLRQPLGGDQARSLLEQFLTGLVIPLWSEGTVWWDVRDANCCWDEEARHLTLIDVEALGAYADEIVRVPQVWRRRDKGQETALRRLRAMTWRLLRAQSPGLRRGTRAGLERFWEAELETALRALGRDPAQKEERKQVALTAFSRFLEALIRAMARL